MRNTAQYPVTIDEIRACLLGLSVGISEEMRMGDIRPLLLKEAAAIIQAYTEAAEYDALMEGPKFKGYNRSQLDRARLYLTREVNPK